MLYPVRVKDGQDYLTVFYNVNSLNELLDTLDFILQNDPNTSILSVDEPKEYEGSGGMVFEITFPDTKSTIKVGRRVKRLISKTVLASRYCELLSFLETNYPNWDNFRLVGFVGNYD